MVYCLMTTVRTDICGLPSAQASTISIPLEFPATHRDASGAKQVTLLDGVQRQPRSVLGSGGGVRRVRERRAPGNREGLLREGVPRPQELLSEAPQGGIGETIGLSML